MGLTMSRFYSEMITWSTVAVAGGAILLGDVDLPPAGTETEQPAQVASADTPADDYPDALSRAPEADPYADIKQAELQEVAFTATEDAPAQMAVDDRPLGRVTAEAVNLRAGPGTGFAIVGRATQGQKLPMTGGRDGIWVEVELTGVDGPAWVHGRYFATPEL
jgi:hypothetical protein